MVNQSNSNITFQGNPTQVKGAAVVIGMRVPEIVLTGADLQDVPLTGYRGKVVVLSVVPSIDTPVCSIQTKRFNREAAGLSGEVALLTVSVDLPFAQARFCGSEGISQVVALSDYKHRTFGEAFGVYLPDVGLLARAVFVLDREGVVRYLEYVPEITAEPSYDEALRAVRGLL